jgi:multiple sugar transport system ATP-binding protein
MLKVVGLSKRLNGKEIVSGASFEVKEKELFCITGPPGSGKSTLLKMLAGLITPDSGEIYLGSEKINDLPPGKRGISMVFENPPIYPDRTAYDNIAFPLMIKKKPKDEIRSRVKEISSLLGIEHILDRKPETFSGGEYQRVALARALVTSPKILLLDEPLKNLDAKIREKMKIWLKMLQRNLGITVIYVTFDPVEALGIGDRIGVMLGGKIEQIDTPKNIIENPKSLSVAEFIGIPTINIFNGTLNVRENKLILEIEDKQIDLVVPNEIFKSISGKKEVIVGIRPEDIELELEPHEKLIEGRTLFLQSLGSENLLTVDVKGEQIKVIVANFSESLGNKVWLKIRKTYVFDKVSKEKMFTAESMRF